MNVAIAMTLEDAIRQAGEGWLIEPFPRRRREWKLFGGILPPFIVKRNNGWERTLPTFRKQPLSRNFGATVHRCEGFFRRLVEDAHRICF